jgi:RPA family protein
MCEYGDGGKISRDDSNRHDRAEMVDEEGQFENSGKVESESEAESEVEGPDCIAVVGKTTVVVMSQGVSFDCDSRESDIEYSFNNDK